MSTTPILIVTKSVWPFCLTGEHERCSAEARIVRGELNRCPCDCHQWPDPPPEQPALEGDDGLICKSHGLAVLMTHVNDGEPCVDYLAGGIASTDHARAALVPRLVEALKLCMLDTDLAAMSGNPIANERHKIADAALAAARKAGVE